MITTDAFAEMGQSTARSLGLPGVAMAAAHHPFDYLGRGEVRAEAERLVDEVVTILTGDADRLEREYAMKPWPSAQEMVITCSVRLAPPGNPRPDGREHAA